MKKLPIFGIAMMLVGIAVSAFLLKGLHEWRVVEGFRQGELTQAQFEARFPVLRIVFRWWDFAPFENTYADRTIPPGRFVHQGMVRHLCLGLGLLFLGASFATYGGTGRLKKTGHGLFVVGFSAALFMTILLHPIVTCWKGK